MTKQKNNTRDLTITAWIAREDWKLEFLSPQVFAYRAVDVTGTEYRIFRDGTYETVNEAIDSYRIDTGSRWVSA